MKVIIDRFEGDYAVCECEDKTMINIERNRIPNGATEGSVLNIVAEEIFLDEEEAAKQEDRIKKLMDELWD